MARLIISGFDELAEELAEMGQATGELAKAMVMAGSDLMARQWAATAIMYEHYDEWEMINSIGYAKTPKEVAGVVRNDIYPRGSDKKSVRNVEKAFLLHYGWNDYHGDHWVDEANELGAEIAYDKMSAMMDQFVKTGEVTKVTITPRRKYGGR